LDYLSIPGMCSINKSRALDLTTPTATSVDVERVFSKGRLVLSHVRNRLSAQSTRALMCLGAWSRMGLVKDRDIMAVVRLPDANGREAGLDSE
jgi:hAT family C-terminal dimerisation region